MYFVSMTYEFWAPYDPDAQHQTLLNAPPTHLHLFDSQGNFRGPFVYGVKNEVDFNTFQRVYTEDTTQIYPIRLFTTGEPYRFWGAIQSNLHFIGAGNGALTLLGTDNLGRDLFSRVLSGGRISLSIGLVGVFLSFILGITLGGISGYYGGFPDFIIQRLIELLLSLPTTPLWMALSAVVPPRWSPIQVYFAITVILSLIGWAGLARVVRGKLLELREHDYVMASKVAGASQMRIIFDHLLPGFMSYLIVYLTLAVPSMILAETALSFLGLGIRAPAVSWGTLLEDAQNIQAIAIQPWLLTPCLFVIGTVLCFNFVGDGLRDAADPYK
jgi:peptide/nickel transport system permease protein